MHEEGQYRPFLSIRFWQDGYVRSAAGRIFRWEHRSAVFGGGDFAGAQQHTYLQALNNILKGTFELGSRDLVGKFLKYAAVFGAGRMTAGATDEGLITYSVEREIKKNRAYLSQDEVTLLREYDTIPNFRESFNEFMNERLGGPARRAILEADGKVAEAEADFELSKRIAEVRTVTDFDRAARHAVNILYHATYRKVVASEQGEK